MTVKISPFLKSSAVLLLFLSFRFAQIPMHYTTLALYVAHSDLGWHPEACDLSCKRDSQTYFLVKVKSSSPEELDSCCVLAVNDINDASW